MVGSTWNGSPIERHNTQRPGRSNYKIQTHTVAGRSLKTPLQASANVRSTWLRSAWWDLCCLGFCWVPFYAWAVFGLGLDGRWGSKVSPALATATVAALAMTYVHRHYTFLLVYGDQGTFSRRARDFIVAPIVAFGVVGAMRGLRHLSIVPGVSPWLVVLVIVGGWNIWHTLMQRYGILRIYAGRARGGLERPEHGRRDFALLWVCALLIAALVLVFRADSFAGHVNSRRVLAIVAPLLQGPAPSILLALVGGLALAVAVRWVKHERAASIPWADRRPRLLFLASTLALFAVFVVHGPIVGYLCFGVAHSLEYIAFVHHFGQRKFAGDPARSGLVARWMRRPWIFAPLISGALLALFVILADHRRSDAYLVYYIGTSLLHFLFDGWIWKVRTPAVGRHLGVG